MRTSSSPDETKNPYDKVMKTLYEHIKSLLKRYPGFAIPLTICTRDTMKVALPGSYDDFNNQPKRFVRLHAEMIHKTVVNMLKARSQIISSSRTAEMDSDNNPVIQAGLSARIAGYDTACLIFLTLLSRDRRYWIDIFDIIEGMEEDKTLLKSWKKTTGTSLHTQKIDDTPLEFGIETL